MKWRDYYSTLTHLIGAILSVPIGIFLVYNIYKKDVPYGVFSFFIFSLSLFLLYLASTVYHMVNISEKGILILKRIDHMMIFILIAGSYTPVCLILLRDSFGFELFCLVWAIAIIGIFIKAFWIDAPRWLSTAIYVIMGWLIVFASVPIAKKVPPFGFFLLLLGGIFYTAGAVIYALKKPNFNFKRFGFHDIFHLFVLAGSFCHVLFMGLYVY